MINPLFSYKGLFAQSIFASHFRIEVMSQDLKLSPSFVLSFNAIE